MRSNIGCWRGSVAGQAGSKRGKRSVGASARSISSFMRTRLTGPLTLKSDDSARPNCWSRNSDSSAGQVLTTSRRTAWPKCRVVSPERSAWRRLVTSASTSRSESRVIRNCEKASTSRPGKSEPRWARITLVSRTNDCPLRSARRRQLDHARQHARHLDDRRRVAPAERVLAGEPGDEVERLVGDLRERMRRVEADRHEQRPDLGLEEAADPARARPRCGRRG